MNSPGLGEEEETLVIVRCLFFFLATQKSAKWGPKQEVGLEQEPRSVYKECFCLFWYWFFCLVGCCFFVGEGGWIFVVGLFVFCHCTLLGIPWRAVKTTTSLHCCNAMSLTSAKLKVLIVFSLCRYFYGAFSPVNCIWCLTLQHPGY